MKKIYNDKIIKIDEINILENENLFDKIKNTDKHYVYVDYIPEKILKNFDFQNHEDIKKFQNIFYKCDSPAMGMMVYDIKNNVIILRDPERIIKGTFIYQNGILTYNPNGQNIAFEKSSEYFFTSISFREILKILINNSNKYERIIDNQNVSWDISKFLLIINDQYEDNHKILKKVK